MASLNEDQVTHNTDTMVPTAGVVNQEPPESRTIMAMPVKLITGYLAIAVFMIGDGVDLSFLSKYLLDLGFSSSQTSLVFSIYGLTAALAAWMTGVVAEIVGARRTMMLGFVIWASFHFLFLTFGVSAHNYVLILFFYGMRGFGYPLFLYSFILIIINNTSGRQVSPALGWFWTFYSIGIGVLGALIPSFTIPAIGATSTLYLSLAFAITGGILAIISRPDSTNGANTTPLKERLSEIRYSVLLFRNPHIVYTCLLRIINTLSMFGFAVIMPAMFVNELNYTTSEWLRIWAVFLGTTVITNVSWGIIGEYLGWLPMIRYFGCLGMCGSTLLFYYLPQAFPGSMAAGYFCSVMLGIFVACFVPLTPMFTAIEPEHKGACISIYNLSASLSNFTAPALAAIFMPLLGVKGVVLIYAALYLLGFILTFIIKVNHPSYQAKNFFAELRAARHRS